MEEATKEEVAQLDKEPVSWTINFKKGSHIFLFLIVMLKRALKVISLI